MSDTLAGSPFTFWICIVQAVVLAFDPFILSCQKIYQKRNLYEENSHLKTDTARDVVNNPFSDRGRMTRSVVETLFSTIIAGYYFFAELLKVSGTKRTAFSSFLVIGSGIHFVTWAYCLALTVVAKQNPLPSRWGWTLNAHLCALYFLSFICVAQNLFSSLWNNGPAKYMEKTLSLAFLTLFNLDLLYSALTVNNGSPFLDEDGKDVNRSMVASIYSSLFFTWLTPFIRLANSRGSSLSDTDLPILPPTYRGYNIYYIFGETRGKKLLHRIYKANRYDILCQACYAFVTPFLYYSTPFLLNRLLITIEHLTAGEKDDYYYLKGVGYVLAMSVVVIITNVLVAQLYYHSQSNIELRVKSMLNLEIYRKTLCRVDTAVISGGKAKTVEESKIDEDNRSEEEDDDFDDDSSPTGMIVNLMSTDSARISDFASWWFVLIESILQLTIGVCFLYTLLGFSCILGILCMVITIPLNQYNSKLYIRLQNDLMKARDKRVSLMNELLQGIRQVKFFAWERNWTRRILNSRDVELKHLRSLYINEVVFSALWQGSPVLFNTIAFWSFTKLEGRELTAPIAFTSIAIFIELRTSMTIIPETIIHMFEAMVSVNRIADYLNDKEIKQPTSSSSLLNSTTPSLQDSVNHPLSSEIKIGFENATIGWPSNKIGSNEEVDVNSNSSGGIGHEQSTETIIEQDSSTFVIKNIDVIFPNNKLSLICGATGSGKTLLMLSLLGETETKEGYVFCPRSATLSSLDASTAINSIEVSADAEVVPKNWILQHAVACAAQTAWLQNASIKNNILFGLPYVRRRYKATLAACALEKDLSHLEDGDETEIGENGITLSGGQKARVALARAVYSRAQNVFLDDVLSAVDAHTAKHIYTQCLQGLLMTGRTMILITHHISLCVKGCSFIVFLKDGRVKLSGSPIELKQSGQIKQLYEEVFEDEQENCMEDSTPEEESSNEDILDKKNPRILVKDENRSSGSVKMRLYKIYLSLFGNWFFWLCLFFTVAGARGLNIAASWWLKQWAQSYEHPPAEGNDFASLVSTPNAFSLSTTFERPISALENPSKANVYFKTDMGGSKLNMYLGIYVLFNFAEIFVVIARGFVAYAGGLIASRKLYIMLLDRILRAPLRFFDTTPVGRIVNRFSKDFETIDDAVSENIMQILGEFAEVLSIAIVAVSVMPPLIVLMILIAVANIYFGSQYVSASRELKRMDSITRSPLFTQFSETIAGVTTIRAFGMTQQFMLDMIAKIDTNSRPMYYIHTITRWASLRIAITGSSISLVTGMFILLNLDYIDAATAGFCLSYIITFTDATFWGVRRYTELEMDFNAVERVVEYLETDQEAAELTDIRTPFNWPCQGVIEVKNLKARYAPDLEPVLRGLTFSVKPQEKIGIVGRTGSGKSTLALAFFRFIDLCEGSITIDDINISDIGTEDLRSNLTIIPQDPVLFSGTLQSNMDPFNHFSEEDIFTALRRVHLLYDNQEEDINENVFKNLQTPVSEGGNNFSQGQRQLLCLARALLKSSRVVLMDEATASVDFETDKAIQKTITTEFSQSTILCIAHRLNTVIEYDRILVLDHGQIVEFARPLELLNDSGSVFYKMCQNSGEFDNLFKLARKKHQLIDVS